MLVFPARKIFAAFFLWAIFSSAALAATAWELARQDAARDIRVYMRHVGGSEYKAFYAVMRVEARLGSVVAVLSDVPAMPEWIARMKSATQLRRDSGKELWLQSIYRLPYPFLEREAVLHSRFRQEKSGVIEIETRAVAGFVQNHPKRVRLQQMQSLWRLTPESGGRVKIELWGQGVPGGYVPPVLFNYNLPDEPAQTLRNLRVMLTRDKYREARPSFVRER